ncbi:MAG TPA: hypothetical protein VLD60_14005 [Nitrospira sp.]|nr:hypothetical protein [Nitrospira sp.]HSD96541.1 hypothetical protein [Sulfuricaulis sp.]
MSRNVIIAIVLCALHLSAIAQDRAGTGAKGAGTEAKELSGMSVLGNTDMPKALYIVPWKTSEMGLTTDLRSGLLNDAMVPVDKEVFMHELEYYEISSR